ncbi:hypothetical protein AAC387_Pa02g0584 [Persea americana]
MAASSGLSSEVFWISTLPSILEFFHLHTFLLPPALVKSDFSSKIRSWFLDEAEKLEILEGECHTTISSSLSVRWEEGVLPTVGEVGRLGGETPASEEAAREGGRSGDEGAGKDVFLFGVGKDIFLFGVGKEAATTRLARVGGDEGPGPGGLCILSDVTNNPSWRLGLAYERTPTFL